MISNDTRSYWETEIPVAQPRRIRFIAKKSLVTEIQEVALIALPYNFSYVAKLRSKCHNQSPLTQQSPPSTPPCIANLTLQRKHQKFHPAHHQMHVTPPSAHHQSTAARIRPVSTSRASSTPLPDHIKNFNPITQLLILAYLQMSQYCEFQSRTLNIGQFLNS